MNQDLWQRIDRLFAETLELAPSERSRFLDQEAADPAVRREIEELLAAHEEAQGFLSTPALGVAPAAASPESLDGAQLGPYRLLRRLGQGGMGAVYLAERADRHFRREVAIKILHPGLRGPDAAQRLIEERQILARLEHPNIARLYDGGTVEDGRPYLVMERIEGSSIDRYCDAHRLTLDQRLELFLKIAEAVQHAHQNLLIHRDLKPANILVTRTGVPKLLDFGIAKIVDPDFEQIKTRAGQRPMTLAYASPEQICGDATTTASDVYSLGVILFELLTGCRPYRPAGSSDTDLEQAICGQPALKPSEAIERAAIGDRSTPIGDIDAAEICRRRSCGLRELKRRLQGDLDTIVLAALRKEPARRYGTADQLAEDLRRHRAELPIRARRDTLAYRMTKFLRRNRWPAAATAVVLALVLALLITVSQKNRRITLERDTARIERDTTEAVLAYVTGILEAEPLNAEQAEVVTVRRVLDRAAAETLPRLAGQPEIQSRLLSLVGRLYVSYGLYEEALGVYETRIHLHRQLPDANSKALAESLANSAETNMLLARHERAEQQAREGLAMVAELAPEDRALIAEHRLQLGDILAVAGEHEEAESMLRSALAVLAEEWGPTDPRVLRRSDLLADLLFQRGAYGEAEALHRRALPALIEAYGPEDFRIGQRLNSLAAVLDAQGELEEAERRFREALDLQLRIRGDQHPETTATRNNLALLLFKRGSVREAAELQRRVLAGFRKAFGERHTNVGIGLTNLGRSELHLGDLDAAEADYSEALEIFEKTLGVDHVNVSAPLLGLGKVALARGDLATCEALLHRSLVSRRAALLPKHLWIAEAAGDLGVCLMRKERFEEARDLLEESHRILTEQLPAEDTRVREALDRLAGVDAAGAQSPSAAANSR